jgi:hypothetical protein
MSHSYIFICWIVKYVLLKMAGEEKLWQIGQGK